MCCFTGSVGSVKSTRIFARPGDGENQILVYQMDVRASDDLALILPIPIAADAPVDAFRFISLAYYPDFFKDLNDGWKEYDAPIPGALSWSPNSTLAVHRVGAFDASFAASIADLDRLDERFKIPRDVWNSIPGMDERGFAVFKLHGLSSESDTTQHPMAFEFPRRNKSELFFPTLHIHDGAFHDSANFDHLLYVQTGVSEDPRMESPVGDDFIEEESEIESRVDIERAAGTVQAGVTVYRRAIFGRFANEDIVLSLQD